MILPLTYGGWSLHPLKRRVAIYRLEAADLRGPAPSSVASCVFDMFT